MQSRSSVSPLQPGEGDEKGLKLDRDWLLHSTALNTITPNHSHCTTSHTTTVSAFSLLRPLPYTQQTKQETNQNCEPPPASLPHAARPACVVTTATTDYKTGWNQNHQRSVHVARYQQQKSDRRRRNSWSPRAGSVRVRTRSYGRQTPSPQPTSHVQPAESPPACTAWRACCGRRGLGGIQYA